MILDLLSTDMYVSYNIKLANKIGLHASIYITELININRKALEKQKMVKENFFKVNREYIEKRTTLTKKEQKEIDELLINLKILHIDIDSKDVLNLDTNVLTAIMLDDRATIQEKLKSFTKKSKPTKNEIILSNMNSEITTNNVELKLAYESWIEAVHTKQGWISKITVQEAQKVIDNYTNKDLDLALQLIKIATIGGYRDMNWAISQFEKEYSKNYFSNLNIQSDQIEERKKIEFLDEEY